METATGLLKNYLHSTTSLFLQIQNACNHFTIAQTKCPSMSEKLAKLRSPKLVLQVNLQAVHPVSWVTAVVRGNALGCRRDLCYHSAVNG